MLLWLLAIFSLWLTICSPIVFLYLLYQKIFWNNIEVIFWFASIDNTWVFSTPLYIFIAAIIINFIWSTLEKVFWNF